MKVLGHPSRSWIAVRPSSSLRTLSRRWRAATLVAAVAGLSLLATPAYAADPVWYVANSGVNGDNGCTDPANPCATIGQAVRQARTVGGGTIMISPGTYPEGIVTNSGEGQTLTFVGTGQGPEDTVISGTTAADLSAFTVFTGSAAFENLSISGNADEDGISFEDRAVSMSITDSILSGNGTSLRWEGDGIDIAARSTPAEVTITETTISGSGDRGIELGEGPTQLTVNDSVLSDNGDAGLAILGEDSTANVTVSDSALSGNGWVGAQADGGTLQIAASTLTGNQGGGIDAYEAGTVVVTDSTLQGNVDAGILVERGASVTLERSTISGTTPEDPGDAAAGVTVVDDGSSIAIDASTIADNTGHGVRAESGTVAVTNSTVSGAFAGSLAAIAVANGSVSVSGTIVAGSGNAPACEGAVTDDGYNLDTDGSCDLGPSSVSGADPLLGALSDNGGATQTMVPAQGPATDVIPLGEADCTADTVDQRGVTRPQGERCDIGAVEVVQDPIVITPDGLPDGVVGEPYSVTLQASGGLGAPYAWTLAEASSLPDGLTFSDDGVLSGTPGAAGTFDITVSVDDAVTKTYTLIIAAVVPSPTPSPETPTTSPSPSSTHPPDLAVTGAPAGDMFGIALLLLGAAGVALVGARRSRRQG